MTYLEFLASVIERGIAACKQSYSKPGDEAKLRGAVAGFSACRELQPDELRALLTDANQVAEHAWRDVHDKKITDDEYWRHRCYCLEVEWVCNSVSAMLVNEGLPPIIPPTARGVFNAARILSPETVKEVLGE